MPGCRCGKQQLVGRPSRNAGRLLLPARVGEGVGAARTTERGIYNSCIDFHSPVTSVLLNHNDKIHQIITPQNIIFGMFGLFGL